MTGAGPIGGYRHPDGEIDLHADRAIVSLAVTNTGDRPIQVGSHYHFAEANRALRFDRMAAYGMRLAIPSGTAVRFEPGESRQVALVGFAGARVVTGGHGLIDGPLDAPEVRERFAASLGPSGELP